MAQVVEIRQVAVGDLIPYVNNAKQHSEDQVTRIASSIREFGFVNPVLIDKALNIIAGHGRVLAAKKLGLETVPCVFVEGLTDAQRKAYILADNRLGELAEWDMDLVTSELEMLQELDFDIDLTGFELPEEEPDQEAEDDEYDETRKVEPRAKRGEIYQLGEHRLMCGDSSSASDLDSLVGGVKGNMVFTDPPYGVSIGDKNKMLNSVQKSGRILENIENDTLGKDELYDLLVKCFSNLREHCEDDCSYYVTSPQGGEIGLMMMMMMMRDAGLEVRHNLIWKKNAATFSMGRLDYDYQHEPIFYTWTKKHNFYGKGYQTTIWEYDKPRKCDLHPTMKPIPLIAHAIENSSKVGDNIIDIFGGSGSTLMACEEMNRKCYMMELDPHYCDVIIDRWESYTGKKAVLVNE